MARIGWTKVQGRDYLVRNFDKKARLQLIGLWRNLKQKMDERAITGEKIWDMRNRSTDDLGVLK
jgi:hypothetical protein